MQQKPSLGLSRLDQVRICRGIEPCRAFFQKIYEGDKKQAVILLNERRLAFPCLYILSPQIDPALYPYLRERLVTGHRLIGRVRGEDAREAMDAPQRDKSEHTALRWIVESGCGEDGMNDEYEEILEHAVSVLINTYRDTGILPMVSDMIFARYRKGRNIHDLTWAYFRSSHPDALKLIAKRLRSTDRRNVELACRLLGIDMPDGDTACCRNRYQSYLKWLRDNDPYLYFTGESMQYASTPAFCRIDLDRKFMQEGTPSYQKTPIVPANGDEIIRLQAFQSLSDEEKAILSEHSHMLHAKDTQAWNRWMRRPIGEQIKIVRAEGEGSR